MDGERLRDQAITLFVKHRFTRLSSRTVGSADPGPRATDSDGGPWLPALRAAAGMTRGGEPIARYTVTVFMSPNVMSG